MKPTALSLILLCMMASAGWADLWDDLAAYEMDGRPDAPPVKVEALIVDRPADAHGPIEQKLIAIMTSTNATQHAKWFACRMLQSVGTEACVLVLKQQLGDRVMSDYARLALERMTESKAAEAALIDALETASDDLKIGILGSLGTRRSQDAVKVIVPLVKSDNAALASAALAALGQIGGPEATAAIGVAKDRPELARARQDALLRCTDTISPEALESLIHEATTFGARVGAFTALIDRDADRARAALVEALKAENDPVRFALIRAAMESGDKAIRDTVVAGLGTAGKADQHVTVGAIKDLRLNMYEKDVIALLGKANDAQLRDAVYHALAVIGGEASYAPLFKAYQETPGDAVMLAISRLPVPAIDAELLNTLENDADMAKRLATLEPLSLRLPEGAVALMNRLAGTGQPDELREAVYATLEKIGDYETCRVFAAAIVEGGDWRRTAQHALKRLGHRMGFGDDIWREAFYPALESAPNDEAREALLAIVDGVAGNESLRYLENILVQDAHPLREAALRAMARWPKFEAGQAWLTILEKGMARSETLADDWRRTLEFVKAERASLRILAPRPQ